MNPAAAPRAVVFDAYGTLFDVYSVGLLAEQLFPGQGDTLARLWREKQLDYTRLVSMAGRYQPFWDLTRAGLRWSTPGGSSRAAAISAEILEPSSMPPVPGLAPWPTVSSIPSAERR